MGYSAPLELERKAACAIEEWPEWFASDARWQTAQRAVTSRHFARSRLLTKFLLYIVAETIQGRTANITEHKIGVLVFDRPSSYSSIQDNIVRTYARQLRRRLAEYFCDEGKNEPLHIQIPVGGYVPVFEPSPFHGVIEDGNLSSSISSGVEKDSGTRGPTFVQALWRRWKHPAGRAALFAAYSIVLVLLTWWAAGTLSTRFTAPPAQDPARPLWASLLNDTENCYIVPSDAGFNILEDVSHHPVPLADYVKGSYLNMPLPQVDAHSAEDMRSQQFTSFADLQIVTALSRLPEFNPQRVFLRFPRLLQLDDLKDSNAIILGSRGSNPWAAIAESKANFHIADDDAMQAATITNANPQPGEAARYESHWSQPSHETYAIISYLPNLGGSGHFLLLEGLDVAGTQAAAETLMHPSVIASILRQATRSDGSMRSFEILIRSRSIASKSAGAEVVGSRIY